MRFSIFAFLMLFFSVFSTNSAMATGLRLIDLPADGAAPSVKAAIWSPCTATPTDVRIGPFVLSATRDCPIADGPYPLIVISHGFGGTSFSHRETAKALADAGFIVAAISHGGDSALDMKRAGELEALTQRPAEVSSLLDYLLGKWTEARFIDAGRVGVFGFSRGGYTALVLAGGVPDFANTGLICPDAQAPICMQMRQKTALPQYRDPDARVKAVVLADPLNAFPSSGDVKAVKIPVQLWSSEHGGDGVMPQDVVRLRDDLPVKPDYRIVKGAAHFSFIAPCPAEMAKAAPQICSDAAGFDRVEFHRGFNADLVSFFKASLR